MKLSLSHLRNKKNMYSGSIELQKHKWKIGRTTNAVQSVKYFTSSRNQEFQEYLLTCSHAREKTMEMGLEDPTASVA